MKNKKNPFKKLHIGSYLRELSIVIIGIGVTLYASNLVTSCNGQRNLNAQLEAIYAELSENKVFLDKHIDQLNRYAQFRNMIASYTAYDLPIPKDSVKQYYNLLDIGIGFTLYKRSAYDLLFYSGNMLLIKDKKQLAAISNCYADLEVISRTWAEINTMKRNMYFTLFGTDKSPSINFDEPDFNKPEWRQMRNFYATFGGGQGLALETQKKIADILRN
jgi:cell division protein FtsB